MKKFSLIIIICGGIVLGGVHVYIRHLLGTAFIQFVEDQKTQGITLTYTSLEKGMGLLKATLTIKDLKMEAQDRWLEKAQVEGDFVLTFNLLHPRTLAFHCRDLLQMAWKSNQKKVPFAVRVHECSGTGQMTAQGKLDGLQGDFKKVTFHKAFPSQEALWFKTEKVSLTLEKTQEKNEFKTHLISQTIELNKDTHPPFGPVIEFLELKARAKELDPALHLKDALNNWFRSTGTAELDLLKLTWGALKLESQGTLSVDENLQPILALSAEVQDMPGVLNALVVKKIISKKILSLVNFAVHALSHKNEEKGVQKFSVTLQDGELSLGPVPLVQDLKIQWDS